MLRLYPRPSFLAASAHIQVRCASNKKGGSSARYLARQKNDVFVKSRKQAPSDEDGCGYVSRSAFKLIQLDDRYRFLHSKKEGVIVDLGAAPGGWTQVIVQRAQKGAKVFALDILPIAAVVGATSLQGDFLDPSVQARLRDMVAQDMEAKEGGFVDVIVSDMMANTTGNTIADSEASLELCRAALDFALSTLKQDSTGTPKSKSSVLVMKHFMSSEADQFRKQELECRFSFVKSEKMEASRKESREQFWVCMGFRG